MMKKSADVEAGLPICKRYRWLAGFTLNTTSELVLTSLAMSLAPLSLIAPVAGLSIVFSALLAHWGCVMGVRERLTRIDWFCTALVLFGVVLATSFGPQNDEVPEYARVQKSFGGPAFLFFSFTCLSVIVGWTVFWLAPCFAHYRPGPSSLVTSFFSGYSAAACGAFSQLFLKIVMVGVRTLINGDTSPLFMPVTWGSAVGLAACAPLQLYLLNMTLASGAVTFTVPLYTSLIMILTIAAGGLLFEEFIDVDKGFVVAFCLAVFFVMIGLFILSHRQQMREHSRLNSCSMSHDAQPSISSSRQLDPIATPETHLRSSSDMGSESDIYMRDAEVMLTASGVTPFKSLDACASDGGVPASCCGTGLPSVSEPEGEHAATRMLPGGGLSAAVECSPGLGRSASSVAMDVELGAPRGHRRSHTYS
mmetsp:Transcript_71494/g.190160  ORF Transcript_71494/g.190160 Transcript_71494/m.190160 type:complete len:421 (+) Transcript_71494:3-1265(+)